MIIILLLSAFGWLLVAMAFELGYEICEKNGVMTLSKHQLCSIYWLVLGVLGFATGGAVSIAHIILIIPIALAHIDLCRRGKGRIGVEQICKSIVQRLRNTAKQIIARINKG